MTSPFRSLILRASIAALGLGLLAQEAAGQITTQRIASGLNNPIWAGAPEGDDRVFICHKNGQIKIWENGVVLAQDFVTVTGVSSGSEQGLFGMAFHPQYESNGYFFVYYTDTSGNLVIARYERSATDRNLAVAGSRQIVLSATQPFSNHNGGALVFGPDGHLYIGTGDGGSANDPSCRAQKFNNLLGKVLRINVDSLPYTIPAGNPYATSPNGELPEIFHYGLRNPFRMSFDRATGDLWIGDVGQNAREEVSFAPAGSSNLNFGWKIMEGTRCNQTSSCVSPAPCNDASYSDPVYELIQTGFAGPLSIMGGPVYRGCALPGEVGNYFFADYNDNRIRSLKYDAGTGVVSDFQDRTTEMAPGGGLSISRISCIGEDGFGEMLIVEHRSGTSGEVYKVVPAGAVPALAVNGNGSGINPVCYTSNLPVIGGLWRTEVDARGHAGATGFWIVGASAAAVGPFGAFERLIGGSVLFVRSRPSTGGIETYEESLPCDPALAGATAFTQAILLGGGLAPTACNRVELSIGYY